MQRQMDSGTRQGLKRPSPWDKGEPGYMAEMAWGARQGLKQLKVNSTTLN